MKDFRWKYVHGVMWDYESIPASVTAVEQPNVLMYKTKGTTSILSNKIARVAVNPDWKIEDAVAKIYDFFGSQPFSWWIGPDSLPEDLHQRVKGYGFKHHDSYFGLIKLVTSTEANDLRYEMREVVNEQDVRAYINVSSNIWGYDKSTQEALIQQRLAYLNHEERRSGLLIVLDSGSPVGYAGYRFSSDGQAMYLAGTGVLEEYRGQGIYRALLTARTQLAKEYGCEWLATQAREGTSEPILRKLGFEEIGIYQVYTKE
ncbi:GNAT family N-acetyltransferase [Pseudalkalibacillus decolorationis]|uniref:GNAT family N-acetyltransferase n=1 Tax=Pseudalkalibacillus decolorationis TaxID=163879 RepID=UPI0021483529|nr:GNAT family N-acetyltransferase [Pseudalkalibacillus decolorationis]